MQSSNMKHDTRNRRCFDVLPSIELDYVSLALPLILHPEITICTFAHTHTYIYIYLYIYIY